MKFDTDQFSALSSLETQSQCNDEQVTEPMAPVMSSTTKIGLWVSSVAMVIFMFGLPVWSKLINDGWGPIKPQWETQCWTPAEEILCGDGRDYMKIAKELNRQRDGHYFGCSCGEGVFGDWVCPVSTTLLTEGDTYKNSFSISYFISTAPGTGAMAAFSAWPILGMWYYGAGHPELIERHAGIELKANEYRYRTLLRVTLGLFQFTYGLFLINTVCVAHVFHTVSVVIFNAAMVVHYLAVSLHMGFRNPLSRVIQVMVWTAVLGIFLGAVYPKSPSWLGQHAFWLAECLGLTMGLGIAPVFAIFL